MEALIKSPVIDSAVIDLYPRAQGVAPGDKQRPTPTATYTQERPKENPAKTPVEARPAQGQQEDQTPESKLKDLIQAQQASFKEAETKAVSEGFAKGLSEGRQAGEEKYASAIEALANLIESAQRSVAALLQESEEIIAAIAFEAVCKIVGKELMTPEGCSSVVRQVLAKMPRDEIISVRVSPKDYECLVGASAHHPNATWVTQLSSLSLEADHHVELGGCILNLRDGNVDGRIETQFRAFAQSLKDAAKGK